DNRTAVLEQQLIGLLARRDQWLPLVTHERRAPRELLESTLAWQVRDALTRAHAAIPPVLLETWCELAAYAAGSLVIQAVAGAPASAHPLQPLLDGARPSAEPADLPLWQALVDLVCTQDGEWRARVDKRDGFPPGNGEARARKDALMELIAALSALPGLQTTLHALRALPAPGYSDAQWDVLQALLDTLRLAAAHLRVVFAARGEVDFAEVAAQAVAALGDADTPSELALRLDYRVRHLLVDEFQDTSRAQWQLLLRLTAGWSDGDGHTLFVVGDPMQSIYRFREADVGLFLRARRDGLGALRPQPLALECNFRSQAGIVDWVNATFARVLPAAEDLNRSGVPYSRATAVRAAEALPAVQVHAFAEGGAAAEAQRVVELVRASRARSPQDSVAILVRNRGHLDEIAPALRAAGIDYRAVDIESLAERPVIDDLRALTWALLHPLDRAAWLAVLRAPWCGLTLADLYALAGDLPRQQSLLGALRDPARLRQLSADGSARIQPVLAVLEAALAQYGRRPLRRWVESTWLALGGPACAAGASALADAAVFFDALQRLASGAMLEDFEQLDLALAELKASPDPAADGSVSVMTIHKSKGLEFDTVIVPGLGRGTRSDAQPLIAWARLSDVDRQDRLLLAPVHATGDERDPSFDFVRALEAEKQRFEDARLLYVAATRARRQLHLLAEVARGKDGDGLRAPLGRSLLARLWPALAADFAAALPPADGEGAAAQPAPTERPAPPLRRLVDWRAPAPRPGLPLPAAAPSEHGEPLRFDWAGETARCIGVVYHRWVQLIAEDGVAQWSAARCAGLREVLVEDLRREGVPEGRLDDAAARVLRALHNTLEDVRGRWLLDSAHAAAASEIRLSVLDGGHARQLVIDRSFIDAGTRWIVDFKTSTHEGGDAAGFVRRELERYRPQLEGYRAALRRLGAEPVRAALYLPLIVDPALRWVEL
ncbi:MAG: UvrD-helicase domain-containing protein, partial [Gammaproteobacteria bacterium]